jgi:hypothetical protein
MFSVERAGQEPGAAVRSGRAVSDDTPIRRLAGGLSMTAGVANAGFAGLCTFYFEFPSASQWWRGGAHGAGSFGLILARLIVGFVPIVIGVRLIVLGRFLSNSPPRL